MNKIELTDLELSQIIAALRAEAVRCAFPAIKKSQLALADRLERKEFAS
jgi:hypothetical protein